MAYSDNSEFVGDDQAIFLALKCAEDTKRILRDLLEQLDSEPRRPLLEPESRRKFAERIYRSRRLRARFFSEDIFAEPAWDILLLLYSLEGSDKRISVNGVCVSAGAPQTTVLRWLDKLARLGLICRERHPKDGRVSWVRLTENAASRIDHYCEEILTRYFERPTN